MRGIEPLSDVVERKVRQLYPSATDQQAARAAFLNYGGEAWHREPNRVRLAALKLAGGSLQELNQCLVAANRDYRDVLAWAEYPVQMKHMKPTRDMVARDRRQYLEWLNASDKTT